MIEEIKDSGVDWIGKIPRDWNIKNIGNYFNQVKNKNQDLTEQNLLSLSYGKIIRKNIKATEGLLPENFSGYNIVNENDIVLRMTDLQNDKKSLRTGLVTEKGIITSAYITLSCKSNVLNAINPHFIHYQLYAFDINKGFYGMGSGVRQNVNFDDIKTINIALPSYKKQQQIVNFLNEAVAKIENIISDTRQSIEELKKYKQSLIAEVVTKGLNKQNIEMKESGTEWIGKIPLNWTITKIGRISELSSGGTPSSNNGEYYDGDIPWVRSLDLKEKEIHSTDRNLSELGLSIVSGGVKEAGSIVIAMYGGSGTIGNSGLLQVNASTNQAICAIQLHKSYYNRFYFYFIQFLRPYWMIYAVGTRKDPNISKQTVQNMPCLVLSMEEQKEIADFLDRKTKIIEDLIIEKEIIINEYEKYKQSLIYEYVTGKKQV